MVPLKNKYRTVLFSACKHNKSNTHNHVGMHRYCVLCKKSGMPEPKYISHSSENWFGKRPNHESLKKWLGGNLGNRDVAVKKFKNSKKKCKEDLKSLKKQNKMLYSISRRTGSHRDIKNIKKIRSNMSKKYESSRSSISIREYESSPLSDSEWYIRWTDELKDRNKLYHVVNNNINKKIQCNDAIDYEPKFDNKFILSSGINRDPLTVVTVTLRGGKKNRANIISGLTWLCDSGYTYSTIKRRNTRLYERRIHSNKVKYSTSTGQHCTTHYAKVPFLCHIFLAAR